jgi:hypothetical protein
VQSLSLTLKSSKGRLRVIQTDCGVCAAFDPAGHPSTHQPYKKFVAIWDTGATGTVITQAVADACGLKPTGMMRVYGVAGAHDTETYLVNVSLPNGIGFANIKVTKGNLAGGADVLIGMDIITTGDFAITNKDGKTTFSFRCPSQTEIDYVAEARQQQQRKQPPKFKSGFNSGQKSFKKKKKH